MSEYESGNMKVTIAHLDELKRSMPAHAHTLARLDAGERALVIATDEVCEAFVCECLRTCASVGIDL